MVYNGGMTQEKQAYEQYLQRGNWRCGESPTGAHHWMVDAAPHEAGEMWAACRYCGQRRQHRVLSPVEIGKLVTSKATSEDAG